MGFTYRYILPLLLDFNNAMLITVVISLVSYFYIKKRNSEKEIVMSNGKQAVGKGTSDPSRIEEIADVEEYSDLSKLVPPRFPGENPHILFEHKRYSIEESLKRSEEYYKEMNKRRSIRFFSSDPVPEELVRNLVKTAGTSPSGAHTEPWTYVAVKDKETKAKIRDIVEEEEMTNYSRRMGEQWTNDLQFVKTSWVKEYITDAPWIILVFRQTYFPLEDGRRRTHYYNEISTSISAGIFLSAVQNAGLVSLTSTPLNCGPAIRSVLDRPAHEKLHLLLPLGYPAEDATVPDIARKPVEEVMIVV